MSEPSSRVRTTVVVAAMGAIGLFTLLVLALGLGLTLAGFAARFGYLPAGLLVAAVASILIASFVIIGLRRRAELEELWDAVSHRLLGRANGQRKQQARGRRSRGNRGSQSTANELRRIAMDLAWSAVRVDTPSASTSAHLLDDDAEVLRTSGLVHETWYQERYGIRDDAVAHYLKVGAADDLDPNPLFSTSWYRETHADRLRGGENPLVHYVRHGCVDNLAPSPMVDLALARARLGLLVREPLAPLFALVQDGAPAALDEAIRRRTDLPRSRPDDAELRWRYLLEGGYRHRDDFVLYRIIGNDLPPRHEEGQSVRNLRFILDHEPDLIDCQKRFILNRISDPATEQELIDLLTEHNAPFIRLPFEPEEYRRRGWSVDYPRPAMVYGPRFERLSAPQQARLIERSYHDKNLYAMNNNGARNVALDDGRGRARWVLPFDGNCYFSTAAWGELRTSVTSNPHYRYVLVPMARVNENRALLDLDGRPPAEEEPQVAFRNDAQERFDEDRRYGRRPKVALLWSLAVPGPWDRWRDNPWEPPRPAHVEEAGQYHWGGWVARLSSGKPQLDSSEHDRWLWRVTAIKQRLQELDAEPVTAHLASGRMVFRSDAALEQQRCASDDALLRDAATRLHEAARARATELERGRPRWSGFPDLAATVIPLTLTSYLLDTDDGWPLAWSLLDRWLGPSGLPPHPTLRRSWHLHDLDQVLDAARLHDRMGTSAEELHGRIAPWVTEHRRFLTTSRASRKARLSTGSADGVHHDLQLAACHAFLHEVEDLLDVLNRLSARRYDRFGRPAEQERLGPQPIPDHELQAWVRIETACRQLQVALESPGSRSEKGLARVLRARATGAGFLVPFRPALGHGEVAVGRSVSAATSANLLRGLDATALTGPTNDGRPPAWWLGLDVTQRETAS